MQITILSLDAFFLRMAHSLLSSVCVFTALDVLLLLVMLRLLLLKRFSSLTIKVPRLRPLLPVTRCCIATCCLVNFLGRICIFFFSSRRRHTRLQGDWSSDV